MVTLLVGTNDVQQSYDLANAPARLQALIQQIITASPKAVVLVSDIPPNTNSAKPWLEQETAAYNSAIPGVVQTLQDQGLHVVFAPSLLSPDEVGPDNIHPTDAGYDQIAVGFWSGAVEAVENGWLQAPDAEGEIPPGCCGPDSYGGHPGSEPGDSDTRWQDTGAWLSPGAAQGQSYRYADMNGDKKADLISINPDQSWTAWLNGGPAGAGWNDWTEGVSRPARTTGLAGYDLRLADMDGDGRPDCIGVDLYGAVNVLVWDGTNLCGKPMIQDMHVHTTGSIPGSSFITFVDVDGDGLNNYVVTDQYGSARVWLRKTYNDAGESQQEAQVAEQGSINQNCPGQSYDDACGAKAQDVYNEALKDYSPWQPHFTTPAVTTTAETVFRWADLDGDGRADLIQLTKQAGVVAWHNAGYNGSNVSQQSLGQIGADRYLPASEFQFADMDGDGKADMIRANSVSGIPIWLNKTH